MLPTPVLELIAEQSLWLGIGRSTIYSLLLSSPAALGESLAISGLYLCEIGLDSSSFLDTVIKRSSNKSTTLDSSHTTKIALKPVSKKGKTLI